MICVTIGRGRHSSLAEEWKQAAEAGVDLVELRIDCLRREPELKRILKERPTPLVFTIRRGVDGGLWRGNEEKRQQLLREAVALGVDYVDLEMDIAPKIRRFGKTKRIVSYHNIEDHAGRPRKTSPRNARSSTPTWSRSPPPRTTLAEASRVLHLATTAKGPTIPIAMGEIGVFTRILGAKFGAPFTYAGFNPERVFAAGMLQYGVLKNDFAYNEINANTEVYGVIGDPIEQSLSPVVHNAAFRKLGLNKVMVPFLVPNGELPAFFKELLWLDIKGCSVTIPHKEAIVPAVAAEGGGGRADGDAATRSSSRRTGSGSATIPTIARRWIRSKPPWGAAISEEEPSPLFEKQVLILGAGGVARAIAFGLTRRGANVTITNRHDERATRLAEEVGCRIDQLVDAGQQPGRRDHQRHSGRHAPQRGRHAASRRGVQPGGNGRLRHDLSPREHDAAQAGARARLPDGHRRGHVSPPGRPAVQALYGPGRADRRDASWPSNTSSHRSATNDTRRPDRVLAALVRDWP